MTSGVYKLTFGQDSIYIGRSQNIESRFKSHISDIKLGKSSKKLIHAYEKFGVPKLTILIEEPNLSLQKDLEVQYISKLDTINNGLNTTSGGEDILYGELNANSKYTNAQIYSVLKLLAYSKDMTLLSISESTDVSLPVVKDISAGTKHLWLSVEYPLEYSTMLDNKKYRHDRSLANLTDKHRFQSTFDKYPKLVSPTGEVIDISESLSRFAQSNGLQIGNLSSVLHGKRKSHKGWKLYNKEE
jgi:hypothetical protein